MIILSRKYIYVTLTDHIYCSYQAVQQGEDTRRWPAGCFSKYPVSISDCSRKRRYTARGCWIISLATRSIALLIHFINAEGDQSRGAKPLGRTKDIPGCYLQAGLRRKMALKEVQKTATLPTVLWFTWTTFLDYLDRSRDNNVSLLEVRKVRFKWHTLKPIRSGSDIYQIIAPEDGNWSLPPANRSTWCCILSVFYK